MINYERKSMRIVLGLLSLVMKSSVWQFDNWAFNLFKLQRHMAVSLLSYNLKFRIKIYKVQYLLLCTTQAELKPYSYPLLDGIKQGSAQISFTDQVINTLGFLGHMASFTTAHLCHSMKQATFMLKKKKVWFCSYKTLFMFLQSYLWTLKFEFHVIFTCHKIVSFWVSFQPLKYANSIDRNWPYLAHNLPALVERKAD